LPPWSRGSARWDRSVEGAVAHALLDTHLAAWKAFSWNCSLPAMTNSVLAVFMPGPSSVSTAADHPHHQRSALFATM
jgi:hypothetical protein